MVFMMRKFNLESRLEGAIEMVKSQQVDERVLGLTREFGKKALVQLNLY